MAFLLPPLSALHANLLALFFALSYVGSLYLSKNARLSFALNDGPATRTQTRTRTRNRDDPDVIRARLAAVSVSTVLSCAVVVLVLATHIPFDAAVWDALYRLGFTAPHPVLAHLITPVLFLGPLYAMLWRGELTFRPRTWDIVFLRNIVVAPLTEEIVFRACMLSVYHLSGASRNNMIFWTPLWFGLAHAHHAYDTYHRLLPFAPPSSAPFPSAWALKRTALQTLLQLAYTTLFGFHCGYLFLRTRSLLPPLSAHVFCNVMGLPGVGRDMRAGGNVAVLTAYLLGVAGYVYTLSRWSEGGSGSEGGGY